MTKRAPLRMQWSKREQDYESHWDRSRSDGHLLYGLFLYGVGWPTREEEHVSNGVDLRSYEQQRDAFRAELRRRGFDPDTFTISVKRIQDPGSGGGRG